MSKMSPRYQEASGAGQGKGNRLPCIDASYWIGVCMIALAACAFVSSASAQEGDGCSVVGSYSGVCVMEKIAEQYSRETGMAKASVQGVPNKQSIGVFIQGKHSVVMYSGPLGGDDMAKLQGQWNSLAPYPKPLGQYVVHVVVNSTSPFVRLSYEQLRDIFKGDVRTWDQLGGAKQPVVVVGERVGSKAREVLEREFMGIWLFRKDMAVCNDAYQVAAKVAKDRNAIGFYLYRQEELKGIKTVAVSKGEKAVAALPTEENVFEGKYSLTEDLSLCLSPEAGSEARSLYEYALGPDAAKIARHHFLFPECDRRRYFASRREADVKNGKGSRVAAIGVDAFRLVVPDMSAEYIRAKQVAQLSYAAVNADVSSIGAFVNGEGASLRELLILGDKPSSRAMELHGEKWNSLGVDKDGKPDGTGPDENMIAGRAAAIIVNPANKVESLTLGQIQAIFQGDVDDWAIIGGTELTPPAGPGGRSGKLDVHAFGLGR